MIIPNDEILNQDESLTQLYGNKLGLFPIYIFSKGLKCDQISYELQIVKLNDVNNVIK